MLLKIFSGRKLSRKVKQKIASAVKQDIISPARGVQFRYSKTNVKSGEVQLELQWIGWALLQGMAEPGFSAFVCYPPEV